MPFCKKDTMSHPIALSIMLAAMTAGLGMTFAPAAHGQNELTYVAGSTKKVSQLTGDFDPSLGKPTLSQTGKRFGVFATDLGSSFEHDGRLFFLFGDTVGRPDFQDGVAWTTSNSPEKIRLNFYLDKDGKWLSAKVPGVSLGAFEVPSGGVSVNGKVYVDFTTDWSPVQDKLMGRSVLAVSEDNGRSFKALYDLSTSKFINVSFRQTGDWLYIFGSGLYRKSDVYLARVKLTDLPERSKLRYFGGLGPNKRPQWSPQEQDAAPLFQHNVVGEFSVSYCDPVKRYVLLYNSPNPRGIVMRSAETPWGPWSEGTVIFDPWRDGGYGHFMHIPTGFKTDKHDAVSDPGRADAWGGEYGPYIMSRFTTGSKGRCRIFYTMSTWNPYQVVVMQTDLMLQPMDKTATPNKPPR